MKDGAITLQETEGNKKVVFAVIGDMMLKPVFEAAEHLQKSGIGVKIVSIINPRRLYRPEDTAWDTCSHADGDFIDDAKFAQLFDGDALIGATGGAPAMLEPVMLRSNCKRDTLSWRRGETTSSAGELMGFNNLTAEALKEKAMKLVN